MRQLLTQAQLIDQLDGFGAAHQKSFRAHIEREAT
jgi:hypothetical protein